MCPIPATGHDARWSHMTVLLYSEGAPLLHFFVCLFFLSLGLLVNHFRRGLIVSLVGNYQSVHARTRSTEAAKGLTKRPLFVSSFIMMGTIKLRLLFLHFFVSSPQLPGQLESFSIFIRGIHDNVLNIYALFFFTTVVVVVCVSLFCVYSLQEPSQRERPS
jgi:hypothetical protein